MRKIGHDITLENRRAAFTLIEVLVVVAIIALLISILLPSLSEARRDARAVACAANMHHVGQAVSIYTGRNRDMLPPAYLYAYDNMGNWKLKQQSLGSDDATMRPNGYLHWSYFLYGDGRVDEKAFQCPALENGGHPRTNPGPTSGWAAGQVDDKGAAMPGSGVTDKQAVWMAYTGNAALMSRNKFVQDSPNDRYNTFVNQSVVGSASRTILVTEFGTSFNAISVAFQNQNGKRVSKAHRPVHPFYDKNGVGWNTYASGGGYAMPGVTEPFYYGNPDMTFGGILPLGSQLSGLDNAIDDQSDVNKLNCVGRQHPGGLKEYGGTANFLYLDSHVEKKSVTDTLVNREWGNRFYSIAGTNGVRMTDPIKIPDAYNPNK